MYPILLHIEHADVYVRTNWVVVLSAALVAMALAIPRLRAIHGLTPRASIGIMALLACGTFVGGRLHHVLNTWSFVQWRMEHVDGLGALVFGGLHAGGAIIGLVLTAAVVLPVWRLPGMEVADTMTVPVLAGIALGRLSCFLNGCCYGTISDAPWAVRFPRPSGGWDYHRYRGLITEDAAWSAPVHPLQLYFAAAAVVILALALRLERRKRYDGQVAMAALLAFALSNAALEAFREQFALRNYWLGVPQLTWTALAMAVGALLWLGVREVQARRGPRPLAP